MAHSELLRVDPLTGAQKIFHATDSEESFHIETREDYGPVIELNTALRNASRSDWKGEMHRVATIPLTVYMKLLQEGQTKDPKAFSRWLNDRDNAVFKAKHGRL